MVIKFETDDGGKNNDKINGNPLTGVGYSQYKHGYKHFSNENQIKFISESSLKAGLHFCKSVNETNGATENARPDNVGPVCIFQA